MTDRIPLDSLTSDQLDVLYAELDRLAASVPLVCASDRHAAKVRGLEAERDRLRTTLDEILRRFMHKGHPGEPCLGVGWISERTVAHWRATLYPPKEN
ncbi:hypothetical protein [Streptomyces sp. NPDC001415]